MQIEVKYSDIQLPNNVQSTETDLGIKDKMVAISSRRHVERQTAHMAHDFFMFLLKI